MKKALFITAMMIFAFAFKPHAQTIIKNSNASDTLINADTSTYIIPITSGYAALRVAPVVTKVSGTVAGKIYSYISDDGTNYNITGDSITLANQATNFNTSLTKFQYTASALPYYLKIVFITSGTVAAIPKIWLTFRKYATQ